MQVGPAQLVNTQLSDKCHSGKSKRQAVRDTQKVRKCGKLGDDFIKGVTLVHWLISWYALVASAASSLCYLLQELGNLLRGELGACPCTDVETWAEG